jgi:cytochrome c1
MLEVPVTDPRRLVSTLCVVTAATLLSACQHEGRPAMPAGGDPERGAVLLVREACGACHVIPGIQEASGEVGPPLGGFARRTMIAGMLPNTPQNLTLWIRSPQSIVPGNAMPDVGLTEQQARDIAAYLDTLR